MAELSSRIGKRMLFPNRTWTRPGLEEEKPQEQINFGNGHRLSIWDGDSMDCDSDPSSGDEVKQIPESTSHPKTPPKFLRNRKNDAGRPSEASTSPGSLMERLGLGVAVGTASPATSEAAEGTCNSLVNDEDYPLPNGTDAHFQSTFRSAFSTSTDTSVLVAPTILRESEAANGIQRLTQQEPGENESVSATHPPSKLISDMRQLLVPLVVRKAAQSSSPSSDQPPPHSDFGNKAHSAITDEICEQFILQAIASVPAFEKIGKKISLHHPNQATHAVVVARAPTPMPSGLGIAIKNSGSISTLNATGVANNRDFGKIMSPHPPPTGPRAMRLPSHPPEAGRHNQGLHNNPTKGKEKEHSGVRAGLSRDGPEYGKAPYRSTPPRSASARRRSASPKRHGYVSRTTRRRSRSREKKDDESGPSRKYRQSPTPSPSKPKAGFLSPRRWRSRSPRPKEIGRNSYHRFSPPPHSKIHSPTVSTTSSKFLHNRGRGRSKSRSRSRSPGYASIQLHRSNRKKSYSPIPRSGPPRGWTRSPPQLIPPGVPYRKPAAYISPDLKIKSRSPDSWVKPTDYENRKLRIFSSEAGSFSKGEGYHPYRRDYSLYLRRGGSSPPPSASTSTLPRRVVSPSPATAPATSFPSMRPARYPTIPQTYPSPPSRTAPHHTTLKESRTPTNSAFVHNPVPIAVSMSMPLPPRIPAPNEVFSEVQPDRNISYYDDGNKLKLTATKIEEPEITVDAGPTGQSLENRVVGWEPPGLTCAAKTSTNANKTATMVADAGVAKTMSTTGPEQVFNHIVDEDQKPNIKELYNSVAHLKEQEQNSPATLRSPSSSVPLPLVDMDANILPGATSVIASTRLPTPVPQDNNVQQPVAGPTELVAQEIVQAEEDQARGKQEEQPQRLDQGRAQTQQQAQDRQTSKGEQSPGAGDVAPAQEKNSQTRPTDPVMAGVEEHEAELRIQETGRTPTPMFTGENKTEAQQVASTDATALFALPCHTVPGVWLVQQASNGIAKFDLDLEIDEQTALAWDLTISTESSNADGEKTMVAHGSSTNMEDSQPKKNTEHTNRPKIKLQLLCFPTDAFNALDWKGDPNILLTQQQSWPEMQDFIITMNPDQPHQRIWIGHDMPGPTGTGRAIRMERYVRLGANTFRLLQLTDLARFTFVLFAQTILDIPPRVPTNSTGGATIEPSVSKLYDHYFDKLRDELLEWQREQKENSQPGIYASVSVVRDEGDEVNA